MAVRISWFLPAVLAGITGLGTAVFVQEHQPDYPIQLVTFQIVMVGAALLVAARERWVWVVALLVLLSGVYLAGMSVGLFYIPTFGAAVWVTARRLNETQATPSFLDTKARKGIIYTHSERGAMKHRQS